MWHMALSTSSKRGAPDPVDRFAQWYAKAAEVGIDRHNAMTLATAGSGGAPSARIVLLKSFDDDGFVFFTNYESRKGRELAMNPRAALMFWWRELGLQVRIEGRVQRVAAEESDAYFESRPRGHQLGAWASRQSRRIAARGALSAAFAKIRAMYRGKPIPRPAHWGGFRLVPTTFEFWTQRDNRLHERVVYKRGPRRQWRTQQIAP
jgi:pyridoxamine 5'-phosphate oxidase